MILALIPHELLITTISSVCLQPINFIITLVPRFCIACIGDPSENLRWNKLQLQLDSMAFIFLKIHLANRKLCAKMSDF